MNKLDLDSEELFRTEGFIKGELSNEYFDGLVPLLYHLNTSGSAYIKQFQFSYMKYVYKHISKRKSHIMMHTRFGRRIVEDFLKNIKYEQLIVREKKSDIFSLLIHKLRFHCQQSKSNSIPIHGENSFSCIFEESNLNDNTITKPSVLSFLENVGCIEIKNNEVFYIEMVDHKFRQSKTDLKRQFTNTTKDYVSTTLHNIKPENESKKFVSRSAASILIGEDQIDGVLSTINKILLNAHDQGFIELEEAEKLNTKKKPGCRVGFQLFSFLTKRT